jgi:signal-transduction protein with cAMP-binding, CBS, and nucleotidyltransferase domain
MEENPKQPITVLPVLTRGKVVGLIRMHDILQAGLIYK